jgi:hexosaminidase
MKSASFLLTLFLLYIVICRAQETHTSRQLIYQHHLMPVPAAAQFRDGKMKIDASFAVALEGVTNARLRAGLDRFTRRLENRTGIQMSHQLASGASKAAFIVQCESVGERIQGVDEDEAYALDISAQGAKLKAATIVGALRGMETFLQLVEGTRDGYYVPFVSIEDKPRFKWRGLLIDVCRHWQPVETIKRNLDGMAALKLNVFHWHLTEDQGFRIESKKYPKLHEMGSDGLYYTQEQVREIVRYARDRGIRVVPEFDMPGHSTSWFVGYPELASAPGPYQIQRVYGIHDPAFDPTRKEIYKFLDGFIGEMATLFPDAYMHIGGDESNGKQWRENPQIKAFMLRRGMKSTEELQTYFNQRLLQILAKHGKKMVGWDEIFQPNLPKTIVVQSWRGTASLSAAAKQGYNSILSAPYYLDAMRTAGQYYLADPLPVTSELTSEEAARVLGGEACMWGENVTSETIDSRIWPRMAAIAERFWSPKEVRDVDDMYRRLDAISIWLEELSLRHNTAPQSLLRRLAADASASDRRPLQTLWRVCEPGSLGVRYEYQKTSQLTPMTHFVDAAVPDQSARRNYIMMVEGLLSDAPRFGAYRESLERDFTEWRSMRPAMDALMERSPILRETEPLAEDLSDLGGAGLEALAYLSANVAPPPLWKEEKLNLLERAAKPKAAVRIVVIKPLRQLIYAAAENAQLKTLAPEEWKRRVFTLAAEKQK